MNTLALVQMAREFAECGREADAQRVMDEACDGLAEPVRETAAASGQSWGGFTFSNVIRRVQMAETLKEFERKEWRREPFWGIDRSVYPERLSGVRFAEPGAGSADFTVMREQARLDYLNRRIESLMESAPKLWYRPGKVGGTLSRELWRSAQ